MQIKNCKSWHWKCLVHTRTVISSVFPDITRLRLRKLCNQCVPEIKVLRFIHLWGPFGHSMLMFVQPVKNVCFVFFLFLFLDLIASNGYMVTLILWKLLWECIGFYKMDRVRVWANLQNGGYYSIQLFLDRYLDLFFWTFWLILIGRWSVDRSVTLVWLEPGFLVLSHSCDCFCRFYWFIVEREQEIMDKS